MIQLVDSYFTTEAAGNPNRLKCSLLEEFAARNGYEVKAYDFRRDPEVRAHMEELKQLVQDENGTRLLAGDSYKSLDVENLLRIRRNPDDMRKVLGEMDTYWKEVYDASLQAAKKNKELLGINHRQKEELEALSAEMEKQRDQATAVCQEQKQLLVENRYLRKMLKTYLYPAIANQILQEEHLLDQADTEVTATAMDELADGRFPAAFSEVAAADWKRKGKDELLLEQMWAETGGDAP